MELFFLFLGFIIIIVAIKMIDIFVKVFMGLVKYIIPFLLTLFFLFLFLSNNAWKQKATPLPVPAEKSLVDEDQQAGWKETGYQPKHFNVSPSELYGKALDGVVIRESEDNIIVIIPKSSLH